MPLVSAVNIRHQFGDSVVLDGATLTIEPGERIGLVGRNGTGKSTLLKAIGGALTPDGGDVNLQRGARVGYLRQDPELAADETLREAAERAFAELHALHRRLHEAFEEMAEAEGADLERLLRRQERLEREIEAAGGYAIDHRIDATLHGLGFTDAQFAINCQDLSGGQRARLALAQLLLEEPDVLLLDEPTNHLDINGRLWLEEFLASEFKGAVLMVSHDRYLLDRVVSRIVEVEDGRLIEYPGNYHQFRKMRYERRLTQSRAYDKQQSKFRQQEEYIRRYKTGQRAKEARGRQSKLEREKRGAIEKPMELETFGFALPKAPRTGDQVVNARGISKRYTNVDNRSGEDVGEKVLFHDLDVVIGRGERWGIIGPNGAGKTTLVRTLLGEAEPDAGTVRLGTNLQIGHFTQTETGVNLDQPVYRYIQSVIRKENPDIEMSEQHARNLAGAFLFSGDEQDKELRVLSGGERSRARLAGLLASAKNLLVLDEPTNHLDIPSAERIEEAMTADPRQGGYGGALLLISHDRALIDEACDHLIVLDGEGGAEIFFGNYSMWRDREAERARDRRAREDEEKRQAAERDKQRRAAEEEKRRERQAAQRASAGKASGSNAQRLLARMSTEQIEERIERIERRIRSIDADLLTPEVWKSPEKGNALGEERARLASELAPLEMEWASRAETG